MARAIICAIMIGFILTGCGGLPGDPIIDNLYTKNVYPGDDSTYDIGASGNSYNTAYINNIILDGLWEDLRTPVNAIKLGAINPPTDATYRGSLVYAFSDKILAQEQIVFFSIQLPHSYLQGSDIEAHVHWIAEDATVGNAIWLLTYSWANIGDAFPVETPVTATGINGGLNIQNLSSFGMLNGAGKTISSMLVCSLKRNSSNVLDTLNGKDVYLVGVDFHYKMDTLGSVLMLTK